jgi:hypothetical protein
VDEPVGYALDSTRNNLRKSVERFIIKTLQPASSIDCEEFDILLLAFDPKFKKSSIQTFIEERILLSKENFSFDSSSSRLAQTRSGFLFRSTFCITEVQYIRMVGLEKIQISEALQHNKKIFKHPCK